MASIIWSDVVAAAPELSITSATSQADVLAFVNQRLALTLFDGEGGPTTRLARIFLAAHLATLMRYAGGGQLIAESAGGLSRSYAPPLMSRGMLGTTAYGMAFLALAPPASRGPQVL